LIAFAQKNLGWSLRRTKKDGKANSRLNKR
jgi:hypothetical protein